MLSTTRRLSRVLKSPISVFSERLVGPDAPRACLQWRNLTALSSQRSGIARGCVSPMEEDSMWTMLTLRASFSSEASSVEAIHTEAVKELYDKMLESVKVKRSMPPNAWLWSMIENCQNEDDIKLLFDILQKLRTFRLSNLRIHSNFNCNLCQEVTKACARVGALDFGKKGLWKHNVYGLTPSIGSAHHLLTYAKEHNDVKLMMDVMTLLKQNDLPLQAGTADIVFSICYNTDNWKLMSKYSKRFVEAGVKLRRSAFDVWMEFASKIGDVESLWEIENLRFKSQKQHTVVSGFSCAKGLLLEHKPEEAAAVIQLLLNQNLTDAKESKIAVELQKLVSEWPLEVIKRRKEEDRMALAVSLNSYIPVMLSKTGLKAMNEQEIIKMKSELDSKGEVGREHQRKFTPSVIEPSFGIGRIIYCLFEHSFYTRPDKTADEQLNVFRFNPLVAPFKGSVLPLVQCQQFEDVAMNISKSLTAAGISHKMDTTCATIGKRYARSDELGVPFAITVDSTSSVTIRERQQGSNPH